MRELRTLLATALVGAVATISSTAAAAANETAAAVARAVATVLPNDNQHPAGTLDRGTLTLTLRAGKGTWRPEGPAGPALSIEAFGETSLSLMVPVRPQGSAYPPATIAPNAIGEIVPAFICAKASMAF